MNEVWLLWFWFLAENSLKGCVITDLKLPFWDITERLLSLLGAAVRCWLLSQNVNKKNFMKFQTLWNFKFLETRENISSLSKCRIGIGRRRICGTLRHKIKEWILTQVIPFQFNAIFWQLTQDMTTDCSSYRTRATISRSWILTIHKVRILQKSSLKKRFRLSKMW